MRRLALVSLGLAAAVAAAPAAHAGTPRQIFVTSVTGNGNLSTWPDAGGQSGLAAGDAICQARAVAAGLPNASGYRAWLSSAAADAYCRLHGFSGQRAANCGQPSLPAAAGPWRRRDGLPFGEAITELLPPDQLVYFPVRQDEFGAPVSGLAWTGTNASGAYQATACADWTSAAPATFGFVGSTDRTSGGWGTAGNGSCSLPMHRLICLESGVGDPLPAIAGWGRRAFLSSALGTGELGSWPQAGGQTGVAAGDAICQSLAAAASLPYPASFKAWLSDGAVDARDRFVHDGPWMRLDRAQVASGVADLTDASLASSINLTEAGEYRANYNVWTGTDAAGLALPERCNDWTDGTVVLSGRGGSAHSANALWTTAFGPACDFASSHLYCLQDLPLVFGDGFESGDTAVWSSSVP